MTLKTFNTSKDIPHLPGRVYFITGGTAGLERRISKRLLAIILHRYISAVVTRRAHQSFVDKINASHKAVNIILIEYNLPSLASFTAAASRSLSMEERLNVLICNAGIVDFEPGVTLDENEYNFGVNHLGHAFLIKLLLPAMTSTACLSPDIHKVNLSSTAQMIHPIEGIAFQTLRKKQETPGLMIPGYSWNRYGQSNLANALYVIALGKMYPNIASVAVHQGIVKTYLIDHLSFGNKYFLKI